MAKPLRRPGEPLTVEFFRKRSTVDNATGCWLWNGAKRYNGYGVIDYNGAVTSAHRVCFQISTGTAFPTNIFICHKCDTPACVNPDHMFAGTALDNMRDMIAKGRGHCVARVGVENHMAKIDQQKVIAIRADTSPIKAIAREFGLAPKTVRQIKKRETWAHVE